MSNVEVAALSRLVAWPNNITALKLPYFNAVVVSHPSAGILMHLCRMHHFFLANGSILHCATCPLWSTVSILLDTIATIVPSFAYPGTMCVGFLSVSDKSRVYKHVSV